MEQEGVDPTSRLARRDRVDGALARAYSLLVELQTIQGAGDRDPAARYTSLAATSLEQVIHWLRDASDRLVAQVDGSLIAQGLALLLAAAFCVGVLALASILAVSWLLGGGPCVQDYTVRVGDGPSNGRALMGRGQERGLVVEDVERDVLAMRLRAQGYTYDQIAREMGYQSVNGAWSAVQGALRRTLQDAGDSARAVEVQRLDMLLTRWWPDVGHPDTVIAERATNAVLRVMERRAKYLGLDMPAQVDVTERILILARQMGYDETQALEAATRIMRETGGKPGKLVDPESTQAAIASGGCPEPPCTVLFSSWCDPYWLRTVYQHGTNQEHVLLIDEWERVNNPPGWVDERVRVWVGEIHQYERGMVRQDAPEGPGAD